MGYDRSLTAGNYNDNDHLQMFYHEYIRPVLNAIYGLWDQLFLKFIVFMFSIPAAFSLGLFDTPKDWWVGLIYLVIIDWASGAFVAWWEGRFHHRIFTRKWFHVIGYIMCCGAAAIIANAFGDQINGLYYLQFLVYLSFYVREGYSIARTWKFVSLFIVVYEVSKYGTDYLKSFGGFKEAVDEKDRQLRRREQMNSNKKGK